METYLLIIAAGMLTLFIFYSAIRVRFDKYYLKELARIWFGGLGVLGLLFLLTIIKQAEGTI